MKRRQSSTYIFNSITQLLIFAILLTVNSAHIEAAVLTVAQDGTGQFSTIQEAVDQATPGDVIVVSPGTYQENLSITVPNLAIKSTDPNDPSVVASTIIDGGNNSSIILASGTDKGALSFLTFDGLTLRNGSSGAAELFDAAAVFNKCIFQNNSSLFQGGAIFIQGGAVAVRNCEFQNNVALGDGAAIFVKNGEDSRGSVLVENSTFDGNISAGDGTVAIEGSGTGGGVLPRGVLDPQLVITGSTIQGSFLDTGAGAAIFLDAADAFIDDCVFDANDAGNDGGAIHCENGSNPTIVNCQFKNNVCINSGGAISSENSIATMINCVFQKNNASGNGGAFDASPGSEAGLFNCVFDGNDAGNFGGAVLNFDADVDMINCTFVHNDAENSGDSIAATTDANTYIANSIIWDNGTSGIDEGGTGTFEINFSVVQGGFPGTGNIDQNPLFVDQLGPDGIEATGDEDLGLQANSPAIDAANNDALPFDEFDIDEDGDLGELLPFDAALNARFVDDPNTADTGAGSGPIVDMGAFEFQLPVLLGDVNLDQQVNLLDVDPFIDRVASGVFQAEADINGDGIVNLLDVDPFIAVLGD